MPTAPTFVTEAEVAWNTTTSTKTTASFSVSLNDVLVVVAAGEDVGTTAFANLPTGSGTAFTWNILQEVTTANRCRVKAWYAIASGAQSMTVSLTESASDVREWGFNTLVFSGSDGIGASTKGDAADSAASIALTTTTGNSAIVAIVTDWEAAVTNVTWPAGLGTWTKQTTFDDANYSVHIGWLADAGASGSKTINPSTTGNTGPDWSMIAVEVKGTTVAASATGFLGMFWP